MSYYLLCINGKETMYCTVFQQKQRPFSAEPLRYFSYLKFRLHVPQPVALFLLENL